MSRSRGALSDTSLDSEYPYQVMLRLTPFIRRNLSEVHNVASRLRAYGLGHSFRFDEEGSDYSIYCFPTFIEAEIFLKAYGGEFLSSADRKRGNWRPRSSIGGEHVRTGNR